MKIFTIFWLTGKSELITGPDAATAMNNAGIGGGALRAMDFYALGDQRNDYTWNTEKRSWDKIGFEEKYSRTEFEGYTHRFMVKFSVDDDWRNDTTINLYSNSDSKEKLTDFLNKKKTEKVISFEIVHKASKEQDEAASEFLKDMNFI